MGHVCDQLARVLLQLRQVFVLDGRRNMVDDSELRSVLNVLLVLRHHIRPSYGGRFRHSILVCN